jgi:hypothetical protein
VSGDSKITNPEFSMHRSQMIEALRRLFTLQYRSLPQFLLRASPHVRPGDERILEALRDVVAQQEIAGRRIADTILSHRGQLPNSTYPMHYANLHYLDLRFLLTRLISEQRPIIKEIERLAAGLKHDRFALELAHEILEQEIGYAKRFGELIAELEPDTQLPSLVVARDPQFSGTREVEAQPFVRNRQSEVTPIARVSLEPAPSDVVGQSPAKRVPSAPDEFAVGG